MSQMVSSMLNRKWHDGVTVEKGWIPIQCLEILSASTASWEISHPITIILRSNKSFHWISNFNRKWKHLSNFNPFNQFKHRRTAWLQRRIQKKNSQAHPIPSSAHFKDEKLPPIYKYPSLVCATVRPRADLDPNANEQFEAMPCTRLITQLFAAVLIHDQRNPQSCSCIHMRDENQITRDEHK